MTIWSTNEAPGRGRRPSRSNDQQVQRHQDGHHRRAANRQPSYAHPSRRGADLVAGQNCDITAFTHR
jgi:hypothetical protein